MQTIHNTKRESIYAKSIARHVVIVEQSEIQSGCDLKTKIPNIRVIVNNEEILLTWDECRVFASMLNDIADVSEHG